MYVDRTYIIYLGAPLACTDRLRIGIQSVIYMNGQYFSFVYQFVYQFGYLRKNAYCVFIRNILAIQIPGCFRRNNMKQSDLSILCIMKKKKELLFCPEFAQVRRLVFYTYKMYFIY